MYLMPSFLRYVIASVIVVKLKCIEIVGNQLVFQLIIVSAVRKFIVVTLVGCGALCIGSIQIRCRFSRNSKFRTSSTKTVKIAQIA